MESKIGLKEKKSFYKNVESIVKYFEIQIPPGFEWVREGNVMHLINNSNMIAHYERKLFKKI